MQLKYCQKALFAAAFALFCSWAGAQNNPIFSGGNGDGYNAASKSQQGNAIFKGGINAGWVVNAIKQQGNFIFTGGNGDGWFSSGKLQQANPIFIGGAGDGWAWQNKLPIITDNFFSGGNGSGWVSARKLPVATDGLFKGGDGDGWASNYRPQSVLPVTWLSFDAGKWQEKYSRLSWQTASEINTSYFEIQRGNDAINFTTIGSTKAVGNSSTVQNYFFTDSIPANGFNYYRIRQVDLNGMASFSPARLVNFNIQQPSAIRFYPNPVISVVNIELPLSIMRENSVINIVDLKGVVLKHVRVPASNNNLIRLNISDLPSAAYILHISNPVYTQGITFIKQ